MPPAAMDAGLDSLGAVALKNTTESRTELEFSSRAFDYPSAAGLAGFPASQLPQPAADEQHEGTRRLRNAALTYSSLTH
jgi:hypothetical protein